MRSNTLFPLWNEVTSYPRQLPALRAKVGSGTPSRRHAFILLLSVPRKFPNTGPHSLDTLFHNAEGVVGRSADTGGSCAAHSRDSLACAFCRAQSCSAALS